MPKPVNPGGHGKGHGKAKRPAIGKWLDKGWECVTIPAGDTNADEIPLDPVTESVAIFGQMFDDDGHKLKHKPHVTVVETSTGAVISTAEPMTQDVQILYEIVAEDGDFEEDEMDGPVLL